MNICWYASLPLQAVILGRLARWRVALWWFGGLLAYEMARSAGLMYARPHGTEAYRLAWALTEPLSAVLVLAAAIEALARQRRATIGIVALAYACLAGLVSGDPVDGLLQLRGWTLLAAAAVLLGSLPWRMRRHSALLGFYCAVDAIQCSGILAGARGESRPAQFLIFGQSACLLLWALYVPEIRKELE